MLSTLGRVTSLTKQGRNFLHISYFLSFTITFLSASFHSEHQNFLLHAGVILTAWRNKTLAPKLPTENLNTSPWNPFLCTYCCFFPLLSATCLVHTFIHLLMCSAELGPADWEMPSPLCLPKSFTSFWAAEHFFLSLWGSSSEIGALVNSGCHLYLPAQELLVWTVGP